MATIRKATVHCPKCKHGFEIVDRGNLSEREAREAFKIADEMFASLGKHFAKLDKLFRRSRR